MFDAFTRRKCWTDWYTMSLQFDVWIHNYWASHHLMKCLRCGLLVTTYVACSVVCVSVCVCVLGSGHTGELCKNGWTNRVTGTIWGADSQGTIISRGGPDSPCKGHFLGRMCQHIVSYLHVITPTVPKLEMLRLRYFSFYVVICNDDNELCVCLSGELALRTVKWQEPQCHSSCLSALLLAPSLPSF